MKRYDLEDTSYCGRGEMEMVENPEGEWVKYVEKKNLLSKQDIQKMREELNKEASLPKIFPPKGREYWDVDRIVATLEYLKEVTP